MCCPDADHKDRKGERKPNPRGAAYCKLQNRDEETQHEARKKARQVQRDEEGGVSPISVQISQSYINLISQILFDFRLRNLHNPVVSETFCQDLRRLLYEGSLDSVVQLQWVKV